jgi:signal transduction histidine kinase
MRKMLRVRLTFWYVGVLAAVLIVFSLGFYSLLDQSLRQRLDGNLRSATQVTALALNHETEEHRGKTPGEENVRLVLNTMHQTSFPRPDIAVWDGKRLVAEKPGTAGVPATLLRVLLGDRSFTAENSFLTIDWNAQHYRVVVASVWVPSSRASYSVIASEVMQPLEAEMGTVMEILLITVPVCLLLAAAGGYFLARKSLAPVLGMARAAERISSHNLDQRLPVGNPGDELGLLAETFNRVFERLQNSFRQQRQFMADASHELRTPVFVALTATQVSLQNRNQPPETPHETLEVVQSQMLRLRRMVEDMFTLAQADSGVYEPNQTTFYIDEVLLESVRAGRVLGKLRNVDVRAEPVEPELEYTGDEGLLRQLLLILLDNAVKYTPAGGHVEISLTVAESGYRIRVADTGCGIPLADQRYIFDRFYRADKSRSRRQLGAGSGAGLGLAIAQWITQQQRGRIWLESSSSHGSVFCVELPLSRRYPKLHPAGAGADRTREPEHALRA